MHIVDYIKTVPAKVATWLAYSPKNHRLYFHVIEPWGTTNYVGDIDSDLWNDSGARAAILKLMATISFNPGWVPDGDVFPEDVPFLEFLLGTYDEVLTEQARKSGKNKAKRGRTAH